MVVGHHPYVIQAIELHKGKYVAYSPENFIFDKCIGKNEGILISLGLDVEVKKMSISIKSLYITMII